MQSYIRCEVYAPAWMQDFACLGGACPRTCCRGWNIPLDEKHFAMYKEISDPELRPAVGSVIRSIHKKHNGRSSDEIFLMVANAPEGICPLLDKKGLCRLQEQYGAYMLCDTCYFYPRLFWKVNEEHFASACLSCPAVLEKALLQRDPLTFVRFECEIDPRIDWLDTSFVCDEAAKRLLELRRELIDNIIRILQDRRHNPATRTLMVISMLNRILAFGAERSQIITADFLQEQCEAVMSGQWEELAPGAFGGREATLLAALKDTFDWGMENAAKPFVDIQDGFSAMLTGGCDPLQIMAENYRSARDQIYLPFIEQHAYLLENFLVNYAFSDLFKQFSMYHDENTTLTDIIRFETGHLTAVYTLIRFVLIKNCLVRGEMTEKSFLESIYEADNSWLHYPEFIKMSVQRMTDLTENTEVIPFLLSC